MDNGLNLSVELATDPALSSTPHSTEIPTMIQFENAINDLRNIGRDQCKHL